MEFLRSSMDCLEPEIHFELQCDLDKFRLLEPNSESGLQLDVAAQIKKRFGRAHTPAVEPHEESKSHHCIASSSLYTHQTLAQERIPDAAQTSQPWSGFQTNPLVGAEVNQAPPVAGSILEPSQQQHLRVVVNEDGFSGQQPISYAVPVNQPRQLTVQTDTVLPRKRARKLFLNKQLNQLLRHFEVNQRPDNFAIAMIAKEIDDSEDRVAKWFKNQWMRHGAWRMRQRARSNVM